MDPRWARLWFALTAAAVAVGVVIGLFISAHNETFRVLESGQQLARFGGSPLGRSLNNLAFFTVQSNLIVGATSLMLAIDPNRTSMPFRVFRLTGLIAITVTFVVFHVALRGLLELDSWAQAADMLVHTIVPIMAIVGWLSFGPRGLTSGRVAKLTAIFPACYMTFTLIRGPLASHWYPYPFADVKALGYPRVIINGLWIGLLFVSLAAAATALDKRLAPSVEREEPGGTPR
jgi:hypothetical protein